MRKLTKRFTQYNIAKYEKASGKSIMDVVNIGNFEVNRILSIIKLGNPDFKTDEDAAKALDDYLAADEDHSLITAFFDLLAELDSDIKVFKFSGVDVKQLYNDFIEQTRKKTEKLNGQRDDDVVEKADNVVVLEDVNK